jgi:hypothetical protein
MHPLLEALTPAEARWVLYVGSIDTFCFDRGIDCTGDVVRYVMVRAMDPDPEPPPLPEPRATPRRGDAEELRDFVKRAVKLPWRLREVAELCFDRGLTLDQCAARLGIARETVRAHLRRLRLLKRMVDARKPIDAREPALAADASCPAGTS